MSIAYSTKNLFFSASELKELLLYNDVYQVLNECKYYNIQTTTESILFKKGDFNLNIKLVSINSEFKTTKIPPFFFFFFYLKHK